MIEMNSKVAKGRFVLCLFEAIEHSFCLSSTSCVMYSIGNGALVARRSVELKTKLSLILLVEILHCSAFTAAVKLEMSVLSFVVMATARKENKRCYLTTGQLQMRRKRIGQEGIFKGISFRGNVSITIL